MQHAAYTHAAGQATAVAELGMTRPALVPEEHVEHSCQEEERVAQEVEAGLGREQKLHEKLCGLEPRTPEWRETLEELSAEARLTSLAWKRHFFARQGRSLMITGQDRERHIGDLIAGLQVRVHPKSLQALVRVENQQRCDPPLSLSTIERLTQGIGFLDPIDWPWELSGEEVPKTGATRAVEGGDFFNLAIARRLGE